MMLFVMRSKNDVVKKRKFGANVVAGKRSFASELWCHEPLSSWPKKNIGFMMMPMD
jgi:hypothetical protein